MLRKHANVILLILAFLFIAAQPVVAQAPTTISYQGRLANDAGEPIISQVSVTFSIYATPTGGTALYSQARTIAPDQNGIFTIELGPIGATVFDGSIRYLGIKVEADAEMTPRQRLSSTPYSFNTNSIPDNSVTGAKIAGGAVANSDLANNAVTGAKVSNGSLTDIDIADEPGIAFNESTPGNSFRPIPAGANALDSITVNAPAAGYIYVWAHTDAAVDHINGTADELYFQVSATAGNITYSDFGFTQIIVPRELPTQANRWYVYSVDAHRPFYVSAAGTYKYYFNGWVQTGAGDNDSFFDLQLTAFYFPTAYGTVEKMGSPLHEETPTAPTGE